MPFIHFMIPSPCNIDCSLRLRHGGAPGVAALWYAQAFSTRRAGNEDGNNRGNDGAVGGVCNTDAAPIQGRYAFPNTSSWRDCTAGCFLGLPAADTPAEAVFRQKLGA